MAAPAARIQVTGAIELRRALKRMGADLKDFTKINKEAAEIVAKEGRGRAPRLTGRLAKSVRAGANQKAGYVMAGNRTVLWAGPIHFGWPRRNISAQPFLYDALDARKGEVIRKYEDRVGDLVQRVGRETP